MEEIDEPAMLRLVDDSNQAFEQWKRSSLQERTDLCQRFVRVLGECGPRFAEQISRQTGKPLKQALGEISTTIGRANKLIELAENALADVWLDSIGNIDRKIAREPIGSSLILCPWNCTSFF